MPSAPEPVLAGRVLDGKYALQGNLGGGRFGQVYRATHIALQKPVAVKVLHAGDELAARDFEQFRLEAEALGRLSHPNIVSVIDFGVDMRGAGTPYLVMELVEGETLEAIGARRGAIDLNEAAPWLRGVAAALDHAHALGVAHGDLTARNVLVVGSGADATVKVIDFGLARVARLESAPAPSEAAAPGLPARFEGTPEYASPERLRGEPPSAASDIYAFSVLAYRLLTGRHPFEGATAGVIHAQLTTLPPAPSALAGPLPGAVDAALLRSLSKRAADRPRTASEVAGALGAAAREAARARWRRREGPRRALLALALALGLVVAGPWVSSLAWVQRLEGATEDLRFALHRPVPPDPRLLLVAIDEASLAGDPRPLSLRGDEFAVPLARALSQGAAVVALDLLLPEAWASSGAFGDLLLEHAPRVVLAMASDGNEVVGPEAVDGLVAGALGPEATSRLFGSVMQFPSADGTVRRASTAVVDRIGGLRPTLAGRVIDIVGASPDAAAAASPGEFLVDYTVDAQAIGRLNWAMFAGHAREGRRFDGRIILVGAEFTGSGDRHRVPLPGRLPGAISGLALQGAVVNTLLAGRPLTAASAGRTWPAVGLWLIGIALPWLWFRRLAPIVLVATGIALTGCGAAVAAFFGRVVVMMAAPLLLGLVAVAAAAVLRAWLPAPPE